MLKQKLIHFPVCNGSSVFQICGLTGTLISSNDHHSGPRSYGKFLPKIQNATDRCSNPYLLSPGRNKTETGRSLFSSSKTEKLGFKFLKKLIRFSRNQFLLARLYASWRVPLFPTARDATLFFRKHAKGDQEELCLPRALFAAKTSLRFSEEGAVVIGVFLPSRAMHAWVIEGEQIADPKDGIWINYQPVAMLS